MNRIQFPLLAIAITLGLLAPTASCQSKSSQTHDADTAEQQTPAQPTTSANPTSSNDDHYKKLPLPKLEAFLKIVQFTDCTDTNSVLLGTMSVNKVFPKYYEGQEKPGRLKVTLDILDTVGHPQLAKTYYGWLDGVVFCDTIHNMNRMRYPRQIANAILQSYLGFCYADKDGFHPANIEDVNVTKVYETADIISFRYIGYGEEIGAAHGYNVSQGITIRKSDGKVISKNLYANCTELSMFKAAMKRKFGKKVNSADINLPSEGQPWIESDGIHYIYGEYECQVEGSAALQEIVITTQHLEGKVKPEIWGYLQH